MSFTSPNGIRNAVRMTQGDTVEWLTRGFSYKTSNHKDWRNEFQSLVAASPVYERFTDERVQSLSNFILEGLRVEIDDYHSLRTELWAARNRHQLPSMQDVGFHLPELEQNSHVVETL